VHLVNRDLWWFLLLLWVILTGLIIWSQSRKKRMVSEMLSPVQQHNLLSGFLPFRRTLRTVLFSAALFFIMIALMDPRWGTRSGEVPLEGIDVVIIMDISRSMLTPDVVPNRLTLAKKEATELAARLWGNRVGLVAFAGYGFKMIPLTSDINAVFSFIDQIDTDMIDIQGSNIEDALKQALGLFQEDTLSHKAIVLFTDGEDTEFDPIKQARKAKEQGVTLFCVGVGTPKGADIPLKDANGTVRDYLKDSHGNIVRSKLNEALLTRLAEITGGAYYHADSASMLNLSRRLDKIKKTRFGSHPYELMEPQYQYFLLIALLCLLLYLFMPEKKFDFKVLSVLLFAAFLFPSQLYSSGGSLGVREYHRGHYKAALSHFREAITQNPDNARLLYNEGVVYLRLTNFQRAAFSFTGLTNSKIKAVRQKAAYNLGISLMAQRKLEPALKIYADLLEKLNPKSLLFKKALNNFLFLKQMISKKNKQKKQQKNQKNGKGKNRKQDQQKQNGKKNKNDKQKQQSKNKYEPKIKSLSDAEKLLSLIEQEEKKHKIKMEHRKGILIAPRQKW